MQPEESIAGIEYLPSEMVPENSLWKNSIVDVRYKDNKRSYFIVEIQMIWSSDAAEDHSSYLYVTDNKWKIHPVLWWLFINSVSFSCGLTLWFIGIMLFSGTFCCADILKVKSKNSRVLKWYFIMFLVMIIFIMFELKTCSFWVFSFC